MIFVSSTPTSLVFSLVVCVAVVACFILVFASCFVALLLTPENVTVSPPLLIIQCEKSLLLPPKLKLFDTLFPLSPIFVSWSSLLLFWSSFSLLLSSFARLRSSIINKSIYILFCYLFSCTTMHACNHKTETIRVLSSKLQKQLQTHTE